MISPNELKKFHKESDNLKHIDIAESVKIRLIDEEAKTIIENFTGYKTVEEYQNLLFDKQIEHIADFKNSNISVRQLSRLTGLTIGIIRKH